MSRSTFELMQSGAGLGQTLGQAHRTVVNAEVESELNSRGYAVKPVAAVVHKVVPTLTRSMAISVACDRAIESYRLPKTAGHPYRCPRLPQQCYMTQRAWNNLVNYAVRYANRYLAGTYRLPSWAQTALKAGTLRGVMGFAGLGAIGDWLKENPWIVESIGDTISNYGEYLTSGQVKDAIEAAAPKGALTKADIPALLAMLQEGGYIPAGKTGEVEKGATAAVAMPGWMTPAMLAGGAVLLLLVMRK